MPSPLTPMDLLQLLWRVDQALGSLSRQMLRTVGATSPQRLALRAIAQDPALTGARLAAVLHVDRSSIAGVLRRLEAAGLLLRSPHPEDARKDVLRLPPRGRAMDALDAGTVEAAMTRALAASSDAEREAVRAFLVRFGAELEVERRVLLGRGRVA